jgi:hypothetical protein
MSQWPQADLDREWADAIRLALRPVKAPKRLRDSVRRALTVEAQRAMAERLRSA